MCGIVGIFGRVDKAKGTKMLEAVKHRGPDSFEVVTTAKHTLGACRLAITGDPQAPAIYEEPSLGIRVLFNGEIYNYMHLRSELEQCGTVFYTDLEAEVIAKAYQCYGMSFAEKLKGMFAIAIIDNDTLILARDRFGIKPLYFCRNGSMLLFASEMKALVAVADTAPELSVEALEEIALFGYIHSSALTPFCGIRQVLPGRVIRWENGLESSVAFYRLPQVESDGQTCESAYKCAVTNLREQLIKSIDLQFCHGHHDKGLYLSGGIDSTTIALVARLILGHPLKTFTLADSATSPDFQAARKVASALRTEHHEYLVTEVDYRRALEDYIFHYETPIGEGVFGLQGGVAFHLLSQYVSEHVRVAFSGEGADEVFGGYYWPHTHPLGFSDRIRSRLRRLQPNVRLNELVDSLFPLPEDELVYRKNIFGMLLNGGLSNYHLQSVDRSGGAHGFEIRPCYLDDDLADHALGLPTEHKVPNKTVTKRILRDMFRSEFERVGLSWILDRKKRGMPAAVEKLWPTLEHLATNLSPSAPASNEDSRLFASPAERYLFQRFKERFTPVAERESA